MYHACSYRENTETSKEGATHIHVNGDLYKMTERHEFGRWLNYNESNGFWSLSMLTDDREKFMLTPMPDLKPKRTKFEFVKCEYGGKASNAVMDFENNDPLYKMINDEYWSIDELDDLFSIILDGGEHIYRRIETEIDERQEFIDACMKSANLRSRDGAHEVYGDLYDSGKFKLVGGE